MTFYEWILKFVNEDSPRGDLACDVRDDKRAKQVGNTLEAWRRHLSIMSGSPAALRAFETAWKAYKKA